jgi:hypothetical protein
MALRFRRTMKIAPGIRLNLTKKGISARVGPKGAGVTIGTSGTTVSAGIPGSGLHVSQKVKKVKAAPSQKTVSTVDATSKSAPQKIGFLGWLGAAAICFSILWLIL